MTSYEQVAKRLVQRATKLGADQAEAYLEVSRNSSVRVREGEIEDLTQATSKGVGLRIIHKGRLGFAYTSDFEGQSLDAFVDRAFKLAQTAAPNKLNGLPQKKDLLSRGKSKAGTNVGNLYDPEVANLPGDWKIRASIEMEKAGKALDPRIHAFNSVGAGDDVSEVYLASSEGFVDSYSCTYVYLFASPVASENGQLQTGYWIDYKRFLKQLDSPEAVGKEASRRALRLLGARKVKSAQVPVIFDPQMAASFVRAIAGAANGDAVYKNSSFLTGMLGKTLAVPTVTIVDDGVLEGGLGTSPFDGEGVPTRKTAIIERGVVKNFLYDSITARKAKAKVTGNAARSYDGLPSIGTNNLYLEPGAQTPEELIRGVKNGFYVTAMLGHGPNVVTGEYSRGANGVWIENGELAYPVQEVTVAGNVRSMLQGIDGIGNDLEFRGSTASPTIRFSELTVSGA
jgi:PmbA protein